MGTPVLPPDRLALLDPVLQQAQAWGFIGSGSLAPHLAHSLAFARLLEWLAARRAAEHPDAWPGLGRLLDLGSGGGLPGLVLACCFPGIEIVLLDASERRAAYLEAAAHALGASAQIQVVAARAEVAGRDPEFRGGFPVVVARAFGPPAVTAECAAPFLVQRGLLVVSEPPSTVLERRWPADGLAKVGMARVAVEQVENEGAAPGSAADATHAHFVVCRQVERCPDRFPRRDGVARKRPLFSGPEPAA